MSQQLIYNDKEWKSFFLSCKFQPQVIENFISALEKQKITQDILLESVLF